MKKNILALSIAAFIYRQYGTQSYLLRPYSFGSVNQLPRA